MIQKRNFVLDKELVENTCIIGLNPSKTVENHLKQLLTRFLNGNLMNTCENSVFVGSPGETGAQA
jgi:hypothetical protein